MIFSWIHSPYLNMDYLAAELYGSPSRLHTRRLRKKLQGIGALEPWEVEQLNQLRQEVLRHLMDSAEVSDPEATSGLRLT